MLYFPISSFTKKELSLRTFVSSDSKITVVSSSWWWQVLQYYTAQDQKKAIMCAIQTEFSEKKIENKKNANVGVLLQ